MKIAYFCGKYPYFGNTMVPNDSYFCGGSIVAAFKLANELAKNNHECSVFTTSYDGNEEFEMHDHLNVFRYPTNFRLFSSNISLKLAYRPLQYSADIVHIHFDLPPTPLWGYFYAKIKNKPLIITYHGDWLDNYGGSLRRIIVKIVNVLIVDRILSKADIIISPSQYYISESQFLKKYQEKIRVIPNGVDFDQSAIKYSKSECREKLGLPKDSKIIMYLGALTPRKGPDILIRSIFELSRSDPDIRLLVCGTGELESALKNLAAKLDLEKNVKFCGYIDESQKNVYFRASDIFCLPSTRSTEVFPLVLLEASACGLPLVVSDLETFRCIVQWGYNGLFTKRENIQDLAEKIKYLLQNEDERTRMGSNARALAEQLSWAKVAADTSACYRELLNIEKVSNRNDGEMQ
jgi:glycosyltransferase involved in cell wall biosynthesis